MENFRIDKEFLLNNEPMQIRSGAIHYFRVHPEDWKHSLHNLKALGFNTVETYVPWNFHEPQEGTFNFSGLADLDRFLTEAKEVGLYAIVRPSPFICAEWEFGGLPAWLLDRDLKPRSRDPRFLEKVDAWYDHLMPVLKKHQLSEGGNILMFQVENEYGSYFEDKEYLRAIARSMRKHGLTMPFFTSDGPWRACLRAGSLIEDDILPTGNFGSRPKENFESMQSFFQEHGKEYPLMCMEFWDGWFNRYNEPVIRRDPEELAQTIIDTLKLGSINLYMFRGGTNFGFNNGCSARMQHDLPQITSYDYGALLDEQGNPTPQYRLLYDKIHQEFPEIEQGEVWVKETARPFSVSKTGEVSLFNTVDTLAEPVESLNTLTMEQLGQNTGYVLYQTQFEKDADQEKLRLIDGRDRMQVYLNRRHQADQYQEEIGADIMLDLDQKDNELLILAENMGRVNYGSKLLAPTQKKGLQQGAMLDLHFLKDWKLYPLPLDNIGSVDFEAGTLENTPSFYRYEAEIDHPADTWANMKDFGKGVLFVNGFNAGRYWNKGPIVSLYIPSHLLKEGANEFIVFDSEGIAPDTLPFTDSPVEIPLENKEKETK